MIRPSIAADRDVMGAVMVCAIDQEPCALLTSAFQAKVIFCGRSNLRTPVSSARSIWRNRAVDDTLQEVEAAERQPERSPAGHAGGFFFWPQGDPMWTLGRL